MAENKDVINVEESGKDWAIVGAFNEYDFGKLVEFYSDAENFLPAINFAKERARGLVADPATKDGQIARKSLAKKIGQIQKAIEDKGMEIARILKAKPKEVDATRKRVKDALLSYKDEVLAPLKEIEARQAEIVEISNLPAQGVGCDSSGLSEILERLDGYAMKDWKESKDDAEDAIREARRQLTDMLARQEKAEADARELEELRKHKEEIERAEREKREAELKKAQEEAARLAKEKEEAERKAREAEEAKLKAEEDKAEAERKANEAMDKLTEDQRQVVDSPKVEPLFPEMDREHKRKVNNEALDAIAKMDELLKLTGGDVNDAKSVAKAIVTAIAKGQIPHVRMMY